MASQAPDEGSDSSKDIDQAAGSGPEREKHMTPFPQNKWGGDDMDKEEKELSQAHEQADPDRSPANEDQKLRANVTDIDEGAGVDTDDKKF